MKPHHKIAVFFCVLGIALVFAIPRWLDVEPDVYEVALKSLSSYDIAIASSPSTCGVNEGPFQNISPELLSAFQSANAPGASLGDIAGLSNHFAIANSTQLAALGAQGLHPSAAGSDHIPIVRISRVGFNASKTEALLCLRAPLGASLLHLRKLSGGWQVIQNESIPAHLANAT